MLIDLVLVILEFCFGFYYFSTEVLRLYSLKPSSDELEGALFFVYTFKGDGDLFLTYFFTGLTSSSELSSSEDDSFFCTFLG
jgi:hypothetical protein